MSSIKQIMQSLPLELERMIYEYAQDKDYFSKWVLKYIKGANMCTLCHHPIQTETIVALGNDTYTHYNCNDRWFEKDFESDDDSESDSDSDFFSESDSDFEESSDSDEENE